jgi:uncharacterized DUF497 family protein
MDRRLDRLHADIVHRLDEGQRLVGPSLAGRVLLAYTDDGSTIRLISARRATKRERNEYERS